MLISVAGYPSIEASAKNRAVYLWQEIEVNTVAKVTCMGRIMKPQLDNIIGTHLSDKNILAPMLGEPIKLMPLSKALLITGLNPMVKATP